MGQNIRSELFFLKQFGFSDRLLEAVYLSGALPMDILFSEETITMKDDFFFTEKDKELSKKQRKYKEFKMDFYNKETFLKKDEKNKIFFKYDINKISELIPNNKLPLFMYSIGNENLLDKSSKRVAIIGTRKPTESAINITKKITEKYIVEGYIIVSGLAEGIDTVSHETAILNLGETIAVLPTNFKSIYPKSNKELATKILNKGLLLTSIGPRENTYKSSFLDRNGYVANISDVIIVVETNLKSGTMNTIRKASEAKKKIFYIEQDDIQVNNQLKEYGGIPLNVEN